MFPEEQEQFDTDLFSSQPFNAAPGFLTGSLTAIPKGIATGLGKMGELAGTAAAQTVGTVIRAEQAAAPWSRELGQLDPEQFQHNVDRNADEYLKATRADPQTVGTAGQILHTVADVGTRVVGGAALGGAVAGAITAGATEFAPAQRELEAQGIDHATAQQLAAAQSVLTGAGALLPGGVGARAAVRIPSGAAINLTVGAASRYNTHQVLADAGYTQQAAQYRVLDGQAMAADVILGSFFGWMRHPDEPFATQRIPQDVVDSGLELLRARQAEIDLAPGIPTTQAARDAHIETLNATEAALVKGDPLPPVQPVSFADTPESLPIGPDKATLEMAKLLKQERGLIGIQEARHQLADLTRDEFVNLAKRGAKLSDAQASTLADALVGKEVHEADFIPNPAQDAAREAATAEQGKGVSDAADGLVSAAKRANEPPKTTEAWVREQINREAEAARVAKAAERVKEGKPAEEPIDPETQHAIDAIDSAVTNNPALREFEYKDPETGEVVKASDALAQLRDQALGDKETALLHEVAAACGGRG
jgi:hypothetical protein